MDLHLSVVVSKRLSLSRRIFTGNVQWIFSGIFQWNFTFASSGVYHFATSTTNHPGHPGRATEPRTSWQHALIKIRAGGDPLKPGWQAQGARGRRTEPRRQDSICKIKNVLMWLRLCFYECESKSLKKQPAACSVAIRRSVARHIMSHHRTGQFMLQDSASRV